MSVSATIGACLVVLIVGLVAAAAVMLKVHDKPRGGHAEVDADEMVEELRLRMRAERMLRDEGNGLPSAVRPGSPGDRGIETAPLHRGPDGGG